MANVIAITNLKDVERTSTISFAYALVGRWNRKIKPDRQGYLNEVIRGIAGQSDPARDVEESATAKDR